MTDNQLGTTVLVKRTHAVTNPDIPLTALPLYEERNLSPLTSAIVKFCETAAEKTAAQTPKLLNENMIPLAMSFEKPATPTGEIPSVASIYIHLVRCSCLLEQRSYLSR